MAQYNGAGSNLLSIPIDWKYCLQIVYFVAIANTEKDVCMSMLKKFLSGLSSPKIDERVTVAAPPGSIVVLKFRPKKLIAKIDSVI